MQLIGFIVIGLLWAAFLLPSFFENRRKAPIASTRSFARSTARLATVASSSAAEAAARRQATQRRLRVLVALAGGAFVTLAVSIWQSSVVWLGFSLGFDVGPHWAFVGDLAMNRFPLRLSPGLPIFAENPDALVESWERLLNEGATTVYPAHGKPFPAEIIRRAIGRHER